MSSCCSVSCESVSLVEFFSTQRVNTTSDERLQVDTALFLCLDYKRWPTQLLCLVDVNVSDLNTSVAVFEKPKPLIDESVCVFPLPGRKQVFFLRVSTFDLPHPQISSSRPRGHRCVF